MESHGYITHNEQYVVSPKNVASKPLVGTRGYTNWSYPITGLFPFIWYKVHLSFRVDKVGLAKREITVLC